MWFFKRKEDDPSLLDRVKRVESGMKRLEAEILDISLGQDILRNKVLRKVQKVREDPELQEEETNGKNPLEGKLL